MHTSQRPTIGKFERKQRSSVNFMKPVSKEYQRVGSLHLGAKMASYENTGTAANSLVIINQWRLSTVYTHIHTVLA